jgi:hypothetical protein
LSIIRIFAFQTTYFHGKCHHVLDMMKPQWFLIKLFQIETIDQMENHLMKRFIVNLQIKEEIMILVLALM